MDETLCCALIRWCGNYRFYYVHDMIMLYIFAAINQGGLMYGIAVRGGHGERCLKEIMKWSYLIGSIIALSKEAWRRKWLGPCECSVVHALAVLAWWEARFTITCNKAEQSCKHIYCNLSTRADLHGYCKERAELRTKCHRILYPVLTRWAWNGHRGKYDLM